LIVGEDIFEPLLNTNSILQGSFWFLLKDADITWWAQSPALAKDSDLGAIT